MTAVEEPNKALLRRDEARAGAEQHFGLALDAIRDMVGYGTNLVIRAYMSSDKDNVPMVVIGVLLKHIVAMLDAVDVLMTQGHSYPALLPVRSAFEASVYIDWILAADSETRARHYIVGNLRDEAMWASRGIPGSPEQKAYEAVLGSTQVDLAKHETDARKQLGLIEGILAKPAFEATNAEFTKRRGKAPYDPEWYKTLGVKSVRQMADGLGRLREYELIYGRGSDAMHAGLYKDQVHFRPGGFTMRSLRHLGDAQDVFRFAMMIAVHSFQVVLARYREDEVKEGAFLNRYRDRWREVFFSIPEVKFKY